MVQVTVAFGKEKYEVEVDPSEPVEVLRLQLYSLSMVPPERQKLLGFPGGILKDDADLSKMTLKENMKIILMGAPDSSPSSSVPVSAASSCSFSSSAPTASSASPSSAPAAASSSSSSAYEPTIFEEDISEWSTCCTRAFFGPGRAILQPTFALRLSNGARICLACAQTCHLPNMAVPAVVKDEAQRPFVCSCPGGLPGQECLFSARFSSASPSSTSKLQSLMLDRMCAAEGELRARCTSAAEQQQFAQGKMRFQSQFQSYHVQVQAYENPELQRKALDLIPVSELEERARANEQPMPHFRDEVAKQLLRWFKGEFFKWVNNPPCQGCNSNATKIVGRDQPSAEEGRWLAGNVEVYQCETCHAFTRFPRYNHPGKLLETRRGRCGEWANCFTLCARAMGFEARFVVDWTDHVWTELYSEGTQKWVHTDCCENIYDAPLTYEAGWGKKLSYVIGFSAEEGPMDVTKRYTRKMSEVQSRRTDVSEEWLATFIADRHRQLASRLPATRQSQLTERRAIEAREMESEIKRDEELKEEEKRTRISGFEKEGPQGQ